MLKLKITKHKHNFWVELENGDKISVPLGDNDSTPFRELISFFSKAGIDYTISYEIDKKEPPREK